MEEKRNVPKLRFPGFTDPWEQRRLGEICEGLSYGVGAAAVPFDGATRYLRITDIDDETHQFLEDDLSSPDPSFSLSDTDYLRPGEIVFARTGASVGKTYLNRDDAGDIVFAGFLIRAVLQEGNNPEFVYQQTLSESYKNYVAITSQRSGQPGVNAQEYSEWILWICDKDEQARIGALFQKFDLLIALHQRKLDHVKELKKGLLQKMFPKEGANVPELRFPGFTDPWEQRKLGEVAHRVIRKNEEGMSDLPLTISAQHGLVDQRDFFNSQVASRDMRGYYLLERGEFAYNKSTSSDSPWGAIKRLTEYEKGCLSTLYICFGLDEGDPDFLVTYYETSRWHRGIRMIAAEGARNHGLLNIAPGDFFETELTLPGKIEEQAAIGALFAKLDSLIALHQRELDHVKELKKGLLQQMFV